MSSPKFPHPDRKSPAPEIEPAPGSLPKKFPENPEPLSSTGRDEAGTPARSGSGEDPLVESGVPDNDPEQPRETDEDKSMQ